METKESTVMKSDLLFADAVSLFIKKIEAAKTYLIYAATGEMEENAEGALEHLKNLCHLQMQLEDLHENIAKELILFDDVKAWGKFE